MATELPALKLGDLTIKRPIIQGGMGVGVSKASLAAVVSREGGLGVIASVGLGILASTQRRLLNRGAGLVLTGLDGGMYLLSTGMEKNKQERVQKGWKMIRRNVEHIRSVVLDLLYIAKEREPEFEPVSEKPAPSAPEEPGETEPLKPPAEGDEGGEKTE